MSYPELSSSGVYLKPNKSTLKKGVFILLIIILFAVVFVAGRLVGRREGLVEIKETKMVSESGEQLGRVLDKNGQLPEFFKKDVNFNLFWQVWGVIQEQYIDRPVPEAQLFYGALMGLVAALDDPYSVFLEPEISREFTEELKGRFEGIGAEIAIKNNRLTIVTPLVDSPAEKAGLKAGDKVYYIDDFETTGISVNEAVDRIRGEKGTTVRLKILRDSESDLREIAVVRDTIKIISVALDVREMADKKLAVIKLTHFNQDTEARLKEVINELLPQAVDGVILDLRGNPGGYIDQAINVASHWVDVGLTVVSEEFVDNKRVQHLSVGGVELKNFKTVVLINQGSASASEIVAGALKDYLLATIVGEKSFGKGSVQNLEQLSDGSSVKLTIARWLTPNNHQIDNVGIEPDVVVELTEDDWNNGRDPQMQKAMEILTAE